MRNLIKNVFGLLAILTFMSVATSCSEDKDLSPANATVTVMRSENFIALQDALNNADAVFNAMRKGSTRAAKKVETVEVLFSKTRSSDGDEMNGFYVVNYEDNAGFALLSADNRRPAVYAISDAGSLHLSDTIQNKSLSLYLNEFLPYISTPTTSGIGPVLPPGPIADSATVEYEFCSPVVKGFLSKFDQTAPFNKYCFDKDGKPAYIGCVPLAVATIMGYYKWPNKIDSYEFDWNAMHSNMNDERWCRLFKVVGNQKYLNATYGAVESSNGTGASQYNIVRTFESCGYNSPTHISTNILTVLRNEINSSNPVLMTGYFYDSQSKSNTGHEWIVDGGYDAITTYFKTNTKKCDTYYHIIWGWGGYNNGFFLFNPNNLIICGTVGKPDNNVVTSSYEFDRNFDITYGFVPKK